MDLDELRCFLAVVEEGSMLGAATKLGVPRGTLRRRIDELEARAGVPLLVRSARGVAATEAGAMLVQRGRVLLAEGAALLSAVRQLGCESSELLRLRLPVDLPPAMIVWLLNIIRAQGSHTRLSLQMSDKPLDGGQDNVDLVCHFDGRDSAESWRVITLARVQLQIMASPDYLRRVGRPETVADLDEHDLLSWTSSAHPADRWPLRSGGFIEVEPLASCNHVPSIRAMAGANLGLALVLEGPLHRLGLPADDLVPVLSDVVGTDIEINLSLPRTLGDSARPSRVIALLQEYLAKAKFKQP